MKLFADLPDRQCRIHKEQSGMFQPDIPYKDTQIHTGFLFKFPGEIVRSITELGCNIFNTDFFCYMQFNIFPAGPDK